MKISHLFALTLALVLITTTVTASSYTLVEYEQNKMFVKIEEYTGRNLFDAIVNGDESITGKTTAISIILSRELSDVSSSLESYNMNTIGSRIDGSALYLIKTNGEEVYSQNLSEKQNIEGQTISIQEGETITYYYKNYTVLDTNNNKVLHNLYKILPVSNSYLETYKYCIRNDEKQEDCDDSSLSADPSQECGAISYTDQKAYYDSENHEYHEGTIKLNYYCPLGSSCKAEAYKTYEGGYEHIKPPICVGSVEDFGLPAAEMHTTVCDVYTRSDEAGTPYHYNCLSGYSSSDVDMSDYSSKCGEHTYSGGGVVFPHQLRCQKEYFCKKEGYYKTPTGGAVIDSGECLPENIGEWKADKGAFNPSPFTYNGKEYYCPYGFDFYEGKCVIKTVY